MMSLFKFAPAGREISPGRFFALSVLSLLVLAGPSFAATTIDGTNHYAFGANVGWGDWRGYKSSDITLGAVIGEYVCSGPIYSANVGWINLGNGNPTNGIQYQNLSANDFGVNQDGLGNLRGYAYGANIGWIAFETNGSPLVNLLTGQMSGFIWSANCGWISLSNASAYVQTDSIKRAPLAPNGLPIPWLLSNFGTTNVDPGADPTGKGMTIGQDYLAGTDPNNPSSLFRITVQSFALGGSFADLTWGSVPSRFYYLQKATNAAAPVWLDSGLGLIPPSPGSTTERSFVDTLSPMRFYQVQAVRPLMP